MSLSPVQELYPFEHPEVHIVVVVVVVVGAVEQIKLLGAEAASHLVPTLCYSHQSVKRRALDPTHPPQPLHHFLYN